MLRIKKIFPKSTETLLYEGEKGAKLCPLDLLEKRSLGGKRTNFLFKTQHRKRRGQKDLYGNIEMDVLYSSDCQASN